MGYYDQFKNKIFGQMNIKITHLNFALASLELNSAALTARATSISSWQSELYDEVSLEDMLLLNQTKN